MITNGAKWSLLGASLLIIAVSFSSHLQADEEESAAVGDEQRTDCVTDPTVDAVPQLARIPDVSAVRSFGVAQPTHRIIHVLDWHYVDKAKFAADLRDLSETAVSHVEMDKRYEQHLQNVAAIQTQQVAILRELSKHGVKHVWVEGVTERDKPVVELQIAGLKEVSEQIASLRKAANELTALGDATDETKQFTAGIDSLEAQHRRDLLQLGAAGQLVVLDELESVLPLEDETAYRAANPVLADGTVVFDRDKNEAREDAQVKRVLEAGGCSVIVLGGAHDLKDNVERLSGGKAEYIRVTPAAWRKLAGD